MDKKDENKKFVFNIKDSYIEIIMGIAIGIILLLVLEQIPAIRKILVPGDIIAKSKSGKVTENMLYKQMKKSYPVSYILELIDNPILEKKYKLTKEQEEEIEKQVETILKQYEGYGYTNDQFFEENGFENEQDFLDYMKLDYRRNLYCIDYFKTIITSEQIEEYYNNNVTYGEINTKHMLVKTSDEKTEKEALATANEIIKKLNSGASFDDVANEYSDKIVVEDVSFDNFNESNYDSNYIDASKSLEVGAYTKEAVKSSYGYHVILCVSKTEKPTLEQAENDIVEILSQDLEAKDPYIRYKALIKLREESKVKFKDSKYEKEYQEYCEQINENS